MSARILIIAGSDPSGGAGIQADIKTVTCLGGYAMSAITALTAQNTQGVFGIHEVPPPFLAQQITLCLQDIGADAIKTGMLHSTAVIETVASCLPADVPLVLDPVMVAKGGSALLQPEAVAALKTLLIPRAALITPNLPEAELLLGRPIAHADAMPQAAADLLALGPKAVLLKGGHLQADELVDILAVAGGAPLRLTTRRIATRNTHGTGCSYASAIATGLGQGLPLPAATARAHAYVQAAINHAEGLGQGHGPLKHNFMLA